MVGKTKFNLLYRPLNNKKKNFYRRSKTFSNLKKGLVKLLTRHFNRLVTLKNHSLRNTLSKKKIV